MFKFYLVVTMIACCCSNNNSNRSNSPAVNESSSHRAINGPVLRVKIIDTVFERFWQRFFLSIKEKNFYHFKQMSLGKIHMGNEIIGINSFIKSELPGIFDDTLMTKFATLTADDFMKSELGSDEILPSIKKGKYLIITVQAETIRNDNLTNVELKFVKLAEGYKFYRYDRYG